MRQRISRNLRIWFWDHFQCPATTDGDPWPGVRLLYQCGRIRFHPGRHHWPE